MKYYNGANMIDLPDYEICKQYIIDKIINNPGLISNQYCDINDIDEFEKYARDKNNWYHRNDIFNNPSYSEVNDVEELIETYNDKEDFWDINLYKGYCEACFECYHEDDDYDDSLKAYIYVRFSDGEITIDIRGE